MRMTSPRRVAPAAVVCLSLLCSAQEVPVAPAQASPVSAPAGGTPVVNHPNCVTPAHMLEVKEYHGPFAKLAASIANKPNILTTHTPHFHPDDRLCSLRAGEKFHLFVSNTAEPVSILTAGFNAAWAHADNDDPQFGQGAKGYFQRFGAAYADVASDEFFTTFLYPAVFRQDPRYYRVAHGPVGKRALHAFNHIFVAHSDSGHLMFNYSEWLGTVSSHALGNVYHPGNEQGLRPLARGVAWGVATDVGWNMLREFWPEVSRHLRIPFVTIEHQ